MKICLLKLIATIVLFRTVSFHDFFILMGAISIVQIYITISKQQQFGFSLVPQMFYILIGLSIMAKIELEVLPASGLIISLLSLMFYLLCSMFENVHFKNPLFMPQKHVFFKCMLSVCSVYLALNLRTSPAKIWISPLLLLTGLMLINFLPGRTISRGTN